MVPVGMKSVICFSSSCKQRNILAVMFSNNNTGYVQMKHKKQNVCFNAIYKAHCNYGINYVNNVILVCAVCKSSAF